MCPWVGSHTPCCGRQLWGLPSLMEYLSPQGALLPQVYGTTASPLWLELRGPAAWQATPSWAVCRHAYHQLLPWLGATFGIGCSLARLGAAALEYRSCHWPDGPAGSPQCVRPWKCRPWCPVPLLPSVHVRVRCPSPRGVCSPVCALCAVRVCCWWLCPSSPPPNFLFCFFSLLCICFVLSSLFFF